MTPEQIQDLFVKLDQIIFLLQASNVAICFLCGFVSMQFIVHAKNQKHLF